MNILYVSSKKSWGGVVSWMQRTAVGLEARGHKIWIISHPDSRFTASVPRYEAPAGSTTPVTGAVRLIPKRLGMDYNPVMILYVIRFIKRNRIDVVVTNIEKEMTVGGAAARLSGVVSIRRIGNEYDISDRFRWRQKHLVDHTIVPSKSVLQKAGERVNWIEQERYTIIHNGSNPVTYPEESILEQRREWGIPEGALVIGCTGELARVKGIDGLMRAFKAIHESDPKVHLVIAGEGRERTNLEDLTRELGIADCTRFAGFSAEPVRAAAAYDIGVLNSFMEGFPNTLIEYMSVGTPVVGTDVGGVREILEHEHNGLMVRAEDDKELLAALSRLVADSDLRARLGREGRATVRDRFSEDIMIDKLENLFEAQVHAKRS